MTEALAAATAAIEGKMSKSLKKVLKKVFASDAHEQLAVADAKLGSVIKVRGIYICVSIVLTELSLVHVRTVFMYSTAHRYCNSTFPRVYLMFNEAQCCLVMISVV